MELTLLSTLLKTGEYGAVFVLLFFLHYIRVQKITKKYSVGACRGSADKCKFLIAKSQANMIRAKLEVLRDGIHRQYAIDLMRALEDRDNGHTLPSIKIADVISSHEQLILLSFDGVEEELKRILLENGIPTVGSEDYNKFVKEKFDLIWSMVWHKYEAKYSSRIYILDLDNRRTTQTLKTKEYHAMMFDLIETGKKIADKGGK
jgi:hypothetical protein